MIPKFRAWDKTSKKMLDVEAINFNSGKFESIGYDITSLRGSNEVELMQSTGLEDKNNKEIFEGDIVRMRNPRDRRQIGMFQVVRVANSPMLGLLDKKLTTEIFNLYEHMRNYYEIIGNIYENPELLEVEE
ncbi:YopX family protein [Streptococcus sp.]